MTDAISLITEPEISQSAGELIPSVAIDRIIAMRNEAISHFMQALAELDTSRTLLKRATSGDHLYGFSQVVTESLHWPEKPEQALRRISRLADQKIWKQLMNDTGMYTFMSKKQRDEWERQLESEDCPEITLDNVLATFRHLHENKADTFEKGVIDVFRALSWDYKTNNPCRMGKKIIVSGFLDTWRIGKPTFSSSGYARLDDLARPFWLLDGKNMPDHRASEGSIFDRFYSECGAGELCDMEYFSVKAFLKGTAHITFKRPDLVDRLNDIIARHYPAALPPQV
ncbi:DUF4942 domain-containing protein [Scandinavium sp. NPDC088450]|uniref:DUF4942 domain-containing protein n=1 Tax=Scandinavium sp. NPDC088450 TaxID=3364514 RepID=UPI00384F4609